LHASCDAGNGDVDTISDDLTSHNDQLSSFLEHVEILLNIVMV